MVNYIILNIKQNVLNDSTSSLFLMRMKTGQDQFSNKSL